MRRYRYILTVVVIATLAATMGSVVLPAKAAATTTAAVGANEPSVEGQPVPTLAREPGAEDAARPVPRGQLRWPEPATTTIDLSKQDAQQSNPVRVQRFGDLSRVRVETLDPKRVAQLGGAGLAVRVGRADGGGRAARVRLTLDYSGFANAYGAGFAARLRVFRLPGCVVQAHDGPCPLTREAVPARNDLAGSRFEVDTDAAAEGDSPSVLMLATAAGGSFAGNFGATDLAPTGKWQTGLSAGAFLYSYPVPQPPMVAGDGPDLSFGYSSSSVDGMTASSNAQAGWTGLGWTLNPGFIERRYKSCADDATGAGKKSDQRNWGHLCWESPDENDGESATTDPTNSELQVSLGGRSSRIVKDRISGGWKTQEDFGWSIQYLSGGASGQPYWQITTLEGDLFRFGYRRDSMWQVPFAGDDPGEPCNNLYNSGGSKYPGMCQGPWRWNLDQVIDANENLMTLTWKREAWRYAWHVDDVCCTIPPTYEYTPIDYDRGGYLERIEWGSNVSVAGSQPSSRMVFNMVSRCSETTIRDDPHADPYPIDAGTGNLSCWKTYPYYYTWDVPDDLLICDRYECPGGGPSFFIVRRLDSIVNYARDPVTGAWEDTTKLQLRFKYIQSPVNGSNGCCTPTLWLDYIRPIGLAGTGDVRLPPVEFDAVELNGRVNWGANWWFTTPKAILPRVATVHNGLGGRLEITYGRTNPCPDGGNESSGFSDWYNGVQWDRGTQDCFRVYDFWFPFGGGPEIFHGVYHKYQVTKVVERDAVGGSPDVVNSFEYQATPAWALPTDYLGTKITVPTNDTGGTTQVETASWSEFRGYGSVRSLKGAGADPNGYTVTTNTFHRGMYDDVYANGALKQATLTDFDGNAVPDRRLLHGRELEERTWRMTTHNANPGLRQYAELESERYEYEVITTGDGPGAHNPSVVNRVRTRSRELLNSGAFRYADKRVAYNAIGLPTRTNDYGEDGVADNSCTVTTYVMLAFPATTEERGGDDCAAGPLLGKAVNIFDADGNLTEVRTWNSPTTSVTVQHTFDDYGRETSTTDELGRVTTFSFNPAVNWPYNGITSTNPRGHRTTNWTSPLHGQVVQQSDLDNTRTTEVDYDQLGRPTKLWGPAEPRGSGTPSTTVSYLIPYDGRIGQPTAAPKSVTAKLRTGQGSEAKWVTTHAYSDGWGRDREVQEASPAGGRIVTATSYDGRGLKQAAGKPAHNGSAAGSGLLNPAPTTLPSWHRYTHDGVERETVAAEQSYSTETRRMSTQYHGADGRTVTPAAGGNNEYWTDSRGRVVRVVEWAYWGVPYETRYEWDLEGNLTKMTDARGNVRTFTYDLAGRRLSTTDPETGTTTSAYDAAGNLLSTVDARGQKVSHAYDELNRPAAVWAGEVNTGTKLAEWRYDTLIKGQLTSATSFANGQAYVDETLEYDAAYRPTRTRLILPASEGALAGSYEFTAAYDRGGNQIEAGMPAIPLAGMPAEKVNTTFTDLGYVDRLTSDYGGGFTYVAATTYTNNGRPVERRYGGSAQVKRTMSWDTPTGRLANLSTWVGATKKQDDDFFYDAADNVTRVLDKALPEPQSECFNYDLRNRLTFAWTTTKPDCSEGWWYSPDWKGPDPYWRNYEYDSVGNMTKQDTAGRLGEYTYTPGKNTVAKVRWPDREDTYSYDTAGNMVSRVVAGQSTTFNWDAQGRLAGATQGGQTSTYVYDTDGDRLIRRDPGRTTVYLGQMELELSGSSVTARRYYTAGDGATVAVRTASGALTWLLGDPQRSEQLAVDDTTGAVKRQRYLPFGARRGGRDDITATDHGFLDKIEDDRTGLVHLGARFYDPVLAKFISADPVLDMRMPEWSNAYSYAANNPISKMDPSGLKPECGEGPGCDQFNREHVWDGKKFKKKKKPKITLCKESKRCRAERDRQYRNMCGASCFDKKSGTKLSDKGVRDFYERRRKVAEQAEKELANKAKPPPKPTPPNPPPPPPAEEKSWLEKALDNPWVKGATVGLAIAGLFGCIVCGAVAAGVSGVSAIVKAKKGDYVGAALDAASAVTGGIGAGAASLAKGVGALNTVRNGLQTKKVITDVAQRGTYGRAARQDLNKLRSNGGGSADVNRLRHGAHAAEFMSVHLKVSNLFI